MPDPLFHDRYEIRALLGGGRFGVVHRALDRNLQREVALKRYFRGVPVIHAYAEARLLLQLRGPQILEVFDAAIAGDDVPYIATEIAQAGTAADAIEASPFGIRPDIAVGWVRDALIGLESTHDHGLVHRDVKPENLFRHQGRTLLGDFGVAAPVGPDGSVEPHGDPHVWAPEMLSGRSADYRADIYSCGVSLYRLVTGVWPFRSNEPAELEALILEARPEPTRNAAPHITDALARVVARAMHPDPDQRYQTARAFNQALGKTGLVRRSWAPVAPHAADHLQCWQEDGNGASRRVCLRRTGSKTVELDTRYSQSGRRVHRDFYVPDIAEDRHPVEAKRLFQRLNRVG